MTRSLILSALAALALAQLAPAQDRARKTRTARAEKRAARSLAGKWDQNGDGQVSIDEFKGATEAFALLDVDASGALDAKEVRLYGRVMQDLTWEKIDRPAMFKTMDANGDGVLTLDELNAAPLGSVVNKALAQARLQSKMGKAEEAGPAAPKAMEPWPSSTGTETARCQGRSSRRTGSTSSMPWTATAMGSSTRTT